MTTLKTLDEAVDLAMRMSSSAPLAKLEVVADQLRAFRDSTELSFDNGYQLMAAMNGVASCIINHADRPRLTEEQIRKARKDRRYGLTF